MASTQPNLWKATIHSFASLKLTVGLLAVALVLVFLATIDQVNLGINQVVQIYFRQWLAYYDIRTGGGWDAATKAVIPPSPVFRLWWPGGYTIGSVFLVNLLAAHALRFKLSWKKSGILILHAGVVLILIGELFTGLTARETQMTIDEGKTVNFSEDSRHCELAIVNRDPSGREKHFTMAENTLKAGRQFSADGLPVQVEILAYYPNARIAKAGQKPEGPGWMPVQADHGAGTGLWMMPVPRATGMNEIDLPLVVVRLLKDGNIMGVWAAALQIEMAGIQRPIPVDSGNWQITLRPARDYKPFCLTLRDFQHNRYAGTNIAKDFSSFVTITEKGLESGRDFRIWMNHPLRHGGYTFYQSSFKNNDGTTVLQVVRNPSRLVPYIACSMVFFGLALQFGISLHQHLGKRRQQSA